MLSCLRKLTAAFRTVLCLILLSVAGSAAAQTQEATEVRIGEHATRPDGALTIPLVIRCEVDQGCGAFSVEISFDPEVIQVERVEQGAYLGASAIEAENSVDGETGTIKLAAAALGEIEATESGELAILHVMGLRPGVSPLHVTALEVGDLQGMPISATAADGSVTVMEAGPLQGVADVASSFQCYSEPARESERVAFVPGGAEITVLGWLEPPRASGEEADVWLSVTTSRDGEPIEVCWTTTQTLLVDVGGRQMPLDAVWGVVPRVTEEDPGAILADTGSGAELLRCTVRAERRGVAVRVGPGTNRAVRSSLPVVGWFEDDAGNRWWKIQPDDYSEFEADRYWVADADVVTTGACDRVGAAEPSRFVSAPPPAVPTSAPAAAPTVAPSGEAFVAAPAAPSAPSSGEPAAQPSSPAQPPSQSGPTPTEPTQPEPVCYTVSIDRAGGTEGGINIVPGPNCEGGRYIAGTVITVTPWGATETIEGCGVTTIHWDTDSPFSAQVSITADCSIYVYVLE